MPRFFFHLYTTGGVFLDEVGLVLPDSGEAVREALRSANQIVGARLGASPAMTADASWKRWRIEVWDEAAAPVFMMPLDRVVGRGASPSA